MRSDIDLDVFIIDDDESIRTSMDSVLRSVGYKVQTYQSGYDFLEAATSFEYGCIILDVRLPGSSGLEMQKRFKESDIRMPIIFITGHGDITMAVQAMKFGAIDFLTKPFRDQDILDAISKAQDIESTRRESDLARSNALTHLSQLSPRERRVLELTLDGQRNKQIAHLLSITESTVKVHRRNIISKLRSVNMAHLARVYSSYI